VDAPARPAAPERSWRQGNAGLSIRLSTASRWTLSTHGWLCS
jgi:hypothetical protein